MLEDAPDAILAQRAADGDEQAFATIVRRHGPYLKAFATRLAGSAADADDALQESLITAWNRLPELQEPARLRSWLSTIVSRKTTDRLRARRYADEVDESIPALGSTPEQSAETSSQMDALAAVLKTLPLEQREVWLLKEVEGYSYDEIAERVGTTTATVRGRLARARASVLDRMTGWR